MVNVRTGRRLNNSKLITQITRQVYSTLNGLPPHHTLLAAASTGGNGGRLLPLSTLALDDHKRQDNIV